MANNIDTYRTLTPYLVVPDANWELGFLEAAFDAKQKSCQRNDDGTIMHSEIEVGNSLLMMGQAGENWKPLSAALYLWIPNVDTAYERALKAGATSESAPEDKPYGHRQAGVVDRNGITWWIGSPISQ